MLRRRETWFVAIVAFAVVGGAAYVGVSAQRPHPNAQVTQPSAQGEILGAFTQTTATPGTATSTSTAAASASPTIERTSTPAAAATGAPTVLASTAPSTPPTAAQTAPPASGFIVFLDDEGVDRGGRIAVVSRAEPGGKRDVTNTRCSRVYFAAGSGICLAERGALAIDNVGQILDSKLQVTGEIQAGGIPSRARVNASGRMAAMTLFVSGDNYAGSAFSTRTFLVDTATKRLMDNMEGYAFVKDGKTFINADFNVWGVTFTSDPNVFYATLGTGNSHFLVRGDISKRSTTVIDDGVECPSLSPDGTRVAFKSRNADDHSWRLAVLDLATMTHRYVSSETRNFDDQAEWLDNNTLIYGVPADAFRHDIWAVPADGSSAPRLLIPHAFSPTVVRDNSGLAR